MDGGSMHEEDDQVDKSARWQDSIAGYTDEEQEVGRRRRSSESRESREPGGLEILCLERERLGGSSEAEEKRRCRRRDDVVVVDAGSGAWSASHLPRAAPGLPQAEVRRLSWLAAANGPLGHWATGPGAGSGPIQKRKSNAMIYSSIPSIQSIHSVGFHSIQSSQFNPWR
ncbi:predicted protein [Histoplasma capsulatum var. duboisii H88]|uniref:Predicted protein n=1 Tax=Ajellomyces capsulatus (strain H88) TaxID=544711 RepID=F0UBT5_AJEC8|nr:predicted protein [Histoplasma capsulatum var. duboisii H88]